MDINTLRNYGLSDVQLKKLDLLDGADDNKISNSVFDVIQAYKTGNTATIEKDNALLKLYEDVKKIIGDLFKKPDEVNKMQEIADSAAEYFVQNGSVRGFKFDGFPKGIQGLHISTSLDYSKVENDTFSIDNEGQHSVERRPDKLLLSISFVIGGKEYTVNSEKEIENSNVIQESEVEKIPDLFKNDEKVIEDKSEKMK